MQRIKVMSLIGILSIEVSENNSISIRTQNVDADGVKKLLTLAKDGLASITQDENTPFNSAYAEEMQIPRGVTVFYENGAAYLDIHQLDLKTSRSVVDELHSQMHDESDGHTSSTEIAPESASSGTEQEE